MNRQLLTGIVALAAMALPAFAVVSPSTTHQAKHRGVRVGAETRSLIEAVQGKAKKTSGQYSRSLVPLKKSSQTGDRVMKRMNRSGSTIQGYMKSSYDDSTNGWYELMTDGSLDFKWKYAPEGWNYEDGEPEFPFNCGFYRKGEVYGFESSSFFGYAFIGHGRFTLDGTIKAFEEDLYEDFSNYTFSCAYDAAKDIAYAYTLNSDGTGYMFQSVNPETWSYSVIKTNIMLEDVCIALTWCLEDSKLYGITTTGKLVNVGSDGTITEIKDLELPETTATCGFTYSPIDSQFALVHSADYMSTLYMIDYPGLTVNKSTELYDVLQYTILICADNKMDPEAPRTPLINFLEFNGAATDGKASVTLPETNFGGSKLTGDIELNCMVDGKTVKTVNAKAGATVEVTFENIAEGKHVFRFVCKHGEYVGSPAEQTLYVGYDIPIAPEEVYLVPGEISWTPYPEDGKGVNGGYVDLEHLGYNIYLNNKKINDKPVTGSSFEFSFPDVDFTTFTAGVESVNHGHSSSITYSFNSVPGGNGLQLPRHYLPTADEAALFTTIPEYQWFYSPFEECFMLDTWGYDEDCWLISPKLHIPAGNTLVKVSFKSVKNAKEAERVSVNLLQSTDTTSAKEIRTIEITDNADFEGHTVMFAPGAEGDYYIGFKTPRWSNGALMALKDINIEITDIPTGVPSECTEIKVEPYPLGELKAKVSFRLPAADAAGSTIGAGETLTANVASGIASATVKGNPGETVSVDIATQQSFNTIEISATSSVGEGLKSECRVFTGVDIPAPLENIDIDYNSDNTRVTLKWEAPTSGINGGYVSPESTTYALCRINDEGNAYIDKELGNVTSYSYTDKTPIHLCELGILSQSVAGNSGLVKFTSVTAGTPHSLPMVETFKGAEIENSGSYCIYNPIIGQIPDETYTQCLSINSLDYLPDSPLSGIGIWGYSCDGNERGRLELPKFSTKDEKNVAIEVEAYCGPSAGKLQLLAKTHGGEYVSIGEIRDNDFTGWKKYRFMLPESLMGREWVQIAVDCSLDEPETYVAISGYIISSVKETDLAVTRNLTAAYAVVGESQTVEVEIENKGMKSAAIPEAKVDIINQGRVVNTFKLTSASQEELAPLQSARLSARWVPTGDELNENELKIELIADDDNRDNNSLSSSVSISKGNGPAVCDLKATEISDGGNVELTWSEPVINHGFEGFENFNSFVVLDRYGDFRNLDGDGLNEMTFALFKIPENWVPKAWQIIGTEDVSALMMEQAEEVNNYFEAASGDKFAAAFTPYAPFLGSGIEADNRMVSSELMPASNFSFRLANLPWYYDTVKVEVSSDGENFSLLETIDLSSSKWKNYEFTLPEGARYFAIAMASSPDYGFAVLLDDISYVPANGAASIAGYDVYRDDTRIAEKVNASGRWIDNAPDSDKQSSAYYIVPVIEKEGKQEHGVKSNTAYTGNAGVDISLSDDVIVKSDKNSIVILGGSGKTCTVLSPSGAVIMKRSLPSDKEILQVMKGIYIVQVGSTTAKVIVS